jgi:hypothetical protein
MLLYDELWFYCRSLCPENMRNCDFVRFLDEENALPDLAEIDIEAACDALYAAERAEQSVGALSPSRNLLLPDPPGSWDASWDNHTHELLIAKTRVSANSARPDRILFDLEVLEHLGRQNVELVGNAMGQQWIEWIQPGVRELDLAHVLTIDQIPNYLAPTGPHHPVIDEVRNDRFLKDFRKWISETAETSSEEATKVKETVERGLREAQEDVFLKDLDQASYSESIGKTLVGSIGDFIVPGVGTGAQLLQDVRAVRETRHRRWQGFLISMRRAANAS